MHGILSHKKQKVSAPRPPDRVFRSTANEMNVVTDSHRRRRLVGCRHRFAPVPTSARWMGAVLLDRENSFVSTVPSRDHPHSESATYFRFLKIVASGSGIYKKETNYSSRLRLDALSQDRFSCPYLPAHYRKLKRQDPGSIVIKFSVLEQ